MGALSQPIQHLSKAAFGLAAVALALAGCGGGNSEQAAATTATATPRGTVDDAQVEKGIKEDLSTASVKVTSAKCPEDVASKAGATFTCSVKFGNGAAGKAKVTQVGPNQFTYELKPGSVQVPGEVADAAVEKQLAAQGAPDATVNCPQNIIVKVGTTVTCDVTGAQGVASGSVTFTFSSDEGSVDPSSVEAS
jgi:Domain of unknown function (DUF4333)